MSDRVAYVVAVLALLFAFGYAAGQARATDDLPDCPEDSVLVGVGNFQSGHWDTYTCGPARDDFEEN